jgi:hypothetical protein
VALTWFAQDSLQEQAGFEPSVPHLIGGVRRAIGKAAGKLRKAPDAGTCVGICTEITQTRLGSSPIGGGRRQLRGEARRDRDGGTLAANRMRPRHLQQERGGAPLLSFFSLARVRA